MGLSGYFQTHGTPWNGNNAGTTSAAVARTATTGQVLWLTDIAASGDIDGWLLTVSDGGTTIFKAVGVKGNIVIPRNVELVISGDLAIAVTNTAGTHCGIMAAGVIVDV